MGFTTGFTGGVTLTLGLAYLTISAHQRNRQLQSSALRTQANLLDALAHDPSTSTSAAAARAGEYAALSLRQERAPASFAETAKERWNAEVEGAVRWAQETDWDAVREDAEGVVGRVWRRAFGGAGPEADAEAAVSKMKNGVEEASSRVTAATRSALKETRAVAARAADAVGEKAEEVKGASKEAIASSVEKGKELVGRTKAAVGLTEQKLETTAGTTVHQASDVEKALHQRFEKRDDLMNRSVEEVLNERYKPVDRRDNTMLRGI